MADSRTDALWRDREAAIEAILAHVAALEQEQPNPTAQAILLLVRTLIVLGDPS